MARATVSYTDYQEGRLPSVCVISGRPTQDRFTYRTVIREGIRSGGIAGRLEGLLRTVDPRAPRNLLLGVIPVDADIRRRLRFRRQSWTAALAVSVALLVTAAWAGAVWSPALAAASAAGTVVSIVRRRAAEHALPVPELTHGGAWVQLRNVHEDFAAAVSEPL